MPTIRVAAVKAEILVSNVTNPVIRVAAVKVEVLVSNTPIPSGRRRRTTVVT